MKTIRLTKGKKVHTEEERLRCMDWARQEGRAEALKEFKKFLDEENIKISDSYFGERCEKCGTHIENIIHHWIDQFYKSLKLFAEEFEKQLGGTQNV
jgi:hypothetical protein